MPETSCMKRTSVHIKETLGSAGLCQHNFEHNAISGASGIMLA